MRRSSVLACLAAACACAWARPHSSQGVLHYRPSYPSPYRPAPHAPARPSLNAFLASYLHAAPHLPAHLPAHARPDPALYGVAEFEPPQQRSFLQDEDAKDIEPLLRYVRGQLYNQPLDYPVYDVNPNEVYPSEQDLYDGSQPSQQDIDLAKLMIDHIAGKYSLDDLETLEREARLEDNTENQLRSLVQQDERSNTFISPYASPASASNSVHRVVRPTQRRTPAPARPARPTSAIRPVERRGQKELPVVVPATSARHPVFSGLLDTRDNKSNELALAKFLQRASLPSFSSSSQQPAEVSAQSSSSQSSSAARGHRAASASPLEVETDPVSSTRSPLVQARYEAFSKYLDSQRQRKMSKDQAVLRRPQKRFAPPADALSQQLNSLKKTVS